MAEDEVVNDASASADEGDDDQAGNFVFTLIFKNVILYFLAKEASFRRSLLAKRKLKRQAEEKDRKIVDEDDDEFFSIQPVSRSALYCQIKILFL